MAESPDDTAPDDTAPDDTAPDDNGPDENDSLPNLQGELRILLQGAQVLTSFLIILPFNADFGRLGLADEWIYIATFLCSLTSLVLFSAPALHHYLRRPMRHPEQFKRTATRLVWVGAVFASLALVLATRLVTFRVLSGWPAWIPPAGVAALLLGVWWWLPIRHELRTRGTGKPR